MDEVVAGYLTTCDYVLSYQLDLDKYRQQEAIS